MGAARRDWPSSSRMAVRLSQSRFVIGMAETTREDHGREPTSKTREQHTGSARSRWPSATRASASRWAQESWEHCSERPYCTQPPGPTLRPSWATNRPRRGSGQASEAAAASSSASCSGNAPNVSLDAGSPPPYSASTRKTPRNSRPSQAPRLPLRVRRPPRSTRPRQRKPSKLHALTRVGLLLPVQPEQLADLRHQLPHTTTVLPQDSTRYPLSQEAVTGCRDDDGIAFSSSPSFRAAGVAGLADVQQVDKSKPESPT